MGKIQKLEKKQLAVIALVITLTITSLLVYNKVARADTAANKVAIKNAYITGIDTGSGNFDSTDGINYDSSSAYTKDSDYTPGNDSNSKNRIIRSFDALTYHLDFEIMGKTPGNDFEERTVSVKITLSDEEAKYVSFDKTSKAGETTRTISFGGIDTYGNFKKDITLYVLGAPNGMKIHPKFEIQESTNTDSNYLVTLGKVSDDVTNYEYDTDKTTKYSTRPNTTGFYNYMPTVVSSKTATMKINLINDLGREGQKANYNDLVGRYLTYEIGLAIEGDVNKGIKGLTMPNGSDITFDVGVSQDGSTKTVLLENNWVRTYSPDKVADIDSTIVDLPYGSGSDASKRTPYPGNLKLTKKDDSNYSANISGYNISYLTASNYASGGQIPKNDFYIGSYAITVFSPRTTEDGKNTITSTMNITNGKATDISNQNISIPSTSQSRLNNYYQVMDYSITGEFYDDSNSKLSIDGKNGSGSISKGTTVTFRTTFNYKKTLSDQGLKEVIKVDPNAYRVIPKSDMEDINITLETTDGKKISKDDFEVKYVSGNYNNENYVATNYDDSTLDSRLSSEDIDTIKSQCSVVNKDLSKYTVDQIMNLYGGPCIKSKDESFEQTFDKISKAKTTDDEKEVPITKVIVQTKKGVVLPDNVKVIVDVPLRVRNIGDITQTYQATVVATSSDYDKNITYYGPRISNERTSITNPDNYKKSTYQGNDFTRDSAGNVIGRDDVLWGDSLRIVNFTSRQVLSVTNKNADGSTKIRYNSNEGETIHYNIKTIIEDNNMNVGADDVWYINNLKVTVTIPSDLEYIPNKKLGTPVVETKDGNTILTYTLPYTKPNQKIKDIYFDANISPTIIGSGVPITVTSKVEAININNEVDSSYFGFLSSSFSIYASGDTNVILSTKVGEEGSVVEKNQQFSYYLKAYNNTELDLNDYSIMDILPSSGNNQGSEFTGNYKVKIDLPTSFGNAKVYCSTKDYSNLVAKVNDKNNEFKECNAMDDFVSATAIKITNISIANRHYMDPIKVTILPTGNSYSNKYVNSFYGEGADDSKFTQRSSNKTTVRVVSRSISGRIFMDVNENGIEDTGDKYLSGMKLVLYKLDNDNNMNKISETTTNNNGEYKFKDLDSGKYKVRLEEIDPNKYDLTLRYGTEDLEHDSDAYKVDDKTYEISNKRVPDSTDPVGIVLSRKIENVTDMNVGLITKKSFGFDIAKYITKVELNTTAGLNTYNYTNQNKVSLSVKNSLKATARVYYGIKIENNSNSAGYVKLVNESIPDGLNFNINDSYNSQWIYQDGQVRSIVYENDLIKPGETRYLQIVLDMPTQLEARSFINTVTLLDIERYEPEKLAADTNAEPSTYEVGDSVSYAGINWHVIKSEDINGDEVVTLLADSGSISFTSGHTSSTTDTYKWSTSKINKYLNGGLLDLTSNLTKKTTLNLSSLYDNVICDDASGTPNMSYGGTIGGTCMSGLFETSKVRLLTAEEFNTLTSSGLTDLSWLYNKKDFWLMNSVWVEQKHDVYGRITDITNVKGLAQYVHETSVMTGYNSSSKNSWTYANTNKDVRPVIKVSSRNVILEQ